MANYSPADYVGNGAQTNFVVPFDYLAQAHVKVRVDGVVTAFTWVDPGTIQISPAPANATEVRITRVTSGNVKVSYTSGQVLAADLNYAYKQPLYRADEVQFDVDAAETNIEALSAQVAIDAAAADADATVAASRFTDFDTRYLGAKSSAPALNNVGGALSNGALYFDTALNALFVYGSSTWSTFTGATGIQGPPGNTAIVDVESFRTGGRNDQQTVSAFFDYMGINGGLGFVPQVYTLTGLITCNAAKTFTIFGANPKTSGFIAGAHGAIRVVSPADEEYVGPTFKDLAFLTSDTTCGYKALRYDNTANITPDGRDTGTYLVNGGDRFTVRNCRFAGVTGAAIDAWGTCIETNNGHNGFFVGNKFTGKRTASLPDSFRAISVIFKDGFSRTITNITAIAGVVKVYWSGGTDGSVYTGTSGSVHLTGIEGELGILLNNRNMKIDTVLNTPGTPNSGSFVLSEMTGDGFPAYTSGGTWEGSPAVTGSNMWDNAGTWYDVYLSNGEGYFLQNNTFIGGVIGLFVEGQLGLRMVGHNHFNSVYRSIFLRKNGSVQISGGNMLTHGPTLNIDITAITKANPAVVSFTASTSRASPYFYNGCGIQFPAGAISGMTQLNSNTYRIANLNRVAGTFSLQNIATGADINSTSYGVYTSGDASILGEQLVLESCGGGLNIDGMQFGGNGTDGKCQGIIIRDCGSPDNRIGTCTFAENGVRAGIRFEGSSNFWQVAEQTFATGEWDNLIENNATGTKFANLHGTTMTAQVYTGSETLVTGENFNNTYGGREVLVRASYAGTQVLKGVQYARDGRQVSILNETDPAAAAAGLLILTHEDPANTLGTERRISFPDRMPRFLLPRHTRQFAYVKAQQLWAPMTADKWTDAFEFFTDLHGSTVTLDKNTSGAGAAVNASIFGADNNGRKPRGIQLLTTGTTATGSASLGLFTQDYFGGLGSQLYLSRTAADVLSTGSEEYAVRTGFHDGVAGSAIADGVYWEYNRTASVNWRCVAMSAGVATYVDSGLVFGINNYRELGIFVNGDGTRADFFYSLDSQTWVKVATSITTNLPTGARRFGLGGVITKSVGTTPSNFYMDYLGFNVSNIRGL